MLGPVALLDLRRVVCVVGTDPTTGLGRLERPRCPVGIGRHPGQRDGIVEGIVSSRRAPKKLRQSGEKALGQDRSLVLVTAAYSWLGPR